MQLSDERIKLSPLGESDFEIFLEILTWSKIKNQKSKIMKLVSKILTYEEEKKAFEIRSRPWNIKSDGWCTLPITDIACGEKSGWIALEILNHETKTAEVGFILKSGVQRRGITSSALKLLKNYAFTSYS